MPNLTADVTDVAAIVRERTMLAHRDAESRPFIVALMGGKLDLAAYTRYLAQLAWVYEALEARPAAAEDPAIIDPRLDRFAAMTADLAALGAVDWRAEHPATPATAAYADHLRAIPADDLPRYLAHHYTRYLGDLSGGQAIARLVARHYGATPEQLGFFRFDDIADIVHYKRAYRENLNALQFAPAQVDAFVAEAISAFDYNTAVFDSLGG
ncbi:MAG: biliverdin-producing heme oxygenase [Leifsonia sp.]